MKSFGGENEMDSALQTDPSGPSQRSVGEFVIESALISN